MGQAEELTILNTLERLQAKLADRYQVERELGKGGMATVYLAKDIRHDREVAIKVLHPELSASIGAERFEREIKLSAKLQHPHILGLIDSGEADGLLYYVMPFVKGESLRDRLDREGQLPIEDAIQITLEVADALGYAHVQNIIHRDIKPENILLSGGHALVADFGIARAATEAGAQKLTQTGMAVGTPVYMAPEQSVGDAVSPSSDLYSLGCVLYEMLAGEPPFTAKNPQALMARHAMEAVPSIRIVRNTVPEEVEDAIFAAMAKVPADRPQTAAQFTEILGATLGATASMRATLRHTASRRVPTGAVRTYQGVAPWWRRPWVIAAAVVGVAAASFATYTLAKPKGGGGLSAEETARRQRYAVLYFDNPDRTPELDPVADGLTEGLIRSLAGAGLTVRGAAAVAPFRGKLVADDSVARALDVGIVARGSVTREGADRVKVTVVLSDEHGVEQTRTSTTVPRDSLFKAEDAVASAVAEKIRGDLGRTVELKETRARAGNLAAWTLYQRAEKARKDAEPLARSDPKQAATLLAGADSLLGQAIQADARWIDPVILRGQVAMQRFRVDPDTAQRAQWLAAGKSYAEQALQLDKNDANAMAFRGTLRYVEWGALPTDAPGRKELLDSAESDLQKAVLADKTLASAYATLSFINYAKKDVSGALQYSRAAHDADAYLRN
ncbi:MAG TPA: serine/threonine-protein kinase, partial [Gemmatimonadales bacterium]|nr:serine/threonine-protein kinase [Gemmatimonadales bacterium]